MDSAAPLIRIGVQKRNGHLFTTSCDILTNNWDLILPDMLGKGHDELITVVAHPDTFLSSPIDATLLTCRLEDIVSNVQDGYLDIGVISSDVLPSWTLANKEIFDNRHGVVIKDIGHAGSQPMIGVSKTFLEANSDMSIDELWRYGVTLSYEKGLPIFTAFAKKDMDAFLLKEDLPPAKVVRRRGTTEAQARMMECIILGDLVSTGGSMENHGFIPAHPMGEESRTLLIARIPESGPKRPVLNALIDAIPGQPVYLINTGTAPA